ncbi:MAG: sulfatase [Mariniblastus sp.]|nr:sulfatase [Mariniblastus sp.]
MSYHPATLLFVFLLLLCNARFGLTDDTTIPEDRPPNVVVIFIDDLGYADIGPFGAANFQTPHLDRMAKEGRKFTDFVASTAVCSASRAALLTGCYHRRVGISGALGPSSNIGINPDEVTLAELCKQKDYATAIYGKWHLGHHAPFLPMQHGFDDYFGLPYSNDMWPYHPGVAHLPMDERLKRWPHLPLIDKNKIVNPEVSGEEQKQLTTQYTEKAVAFINSHKDQPFFLYVPHSMVHVPLYVSDKFAGKSKAGLMGDVMLEVDWSVGQILEALKQNQLEQNTLVLFTSDNGPWLSYGEHAGSATPLREGKGTMFEGGYRVPTVFWWPGKIPAGTTCDELASTIDIFPTVAKLIDTHLPQHKIDGHDIRPLLFDEPGAESPHDMFYCYYRAGELQAVRNRRWKLHAPHAYRTLNGRPGGTGGMPAKYDQQTIGIALYDLKTDVGETNNVADDHPEIVAKLSEALNQGRADLGDRLTGTKGSGIRPAGTIKNLSER